MFFKYKPAVASLPKQFLTLAARAQKEQMEGAWDDIIKAKYPILDVLERQARQGKTELYWLPVEGMDTPQHQKACHRMLCDEGFNVTMECGGCKVHL